MERLIIAILLCLFGTNVYALDYHLVNEELPKEKELFMWVEVIPGLIPEKRQTIYISHYRKDEHYNKVAYWGGWFTFDMEDIEKMFTEGVPIHYLP